MSLVPTATRSPLAIRSDNWSPSRTTCAVARWIVRYTACNRLNVSQRCRIRLPAEVTTANATTTAVQATRPDVDRCTISSSARPIAYGVSARLAIHRQPQNTPHPRVLDAPRPSHSRNRTGERVSGTERVLGTEPPAAGTVAGTPAPVGPPISRRTAFDTTSNPPGCRRRRAGRVGDDVLTVGRDRSLVRRLFVRVGAPTPHGRGRSAP